MIVVNGKGVDKSKPLDAACPKCLSAPGKPCMGVARNGVRPVRKSNHVERWNLWIGLQRRQGSKVHFRSDTQVVVKENVKVVRPKAVPGPVFREPKPAQFDRFMASERWAKTREAALVKNGRQCASCGCSDDLEAYHRTYERFMREYAQDLVIMCPGCWSLVEVRAERVKLVAAISQVVGEGRKARDAGRSKSNAPAGWKPAHERSGKADWHTETRTYRGVTGQDK